MTGKFDVTFHRGGAAGFTWVGDAGGRDEALARATLAWRGTWRLMGGPDGLGGFDEARVEDSPTYAGHARWCAHRAAFGKLMRPRSRSYDQLNPAARGWSRALLARDPRSRESDFLPHTGMRGSVTVALNAPQATIYHNSVNVGMSHDLEVLTETLDAVMACAMAAAWAKRLSCESDAMISPANPLFWEAASATLRAAGVGRVMTRDAGAALSAIGELDRLGYRELAGDYREAHGL